MITVERYHDICAGHRVYGHESKCAHLHGHNYRIHFKIAGDLDGIGRVIDFSIIKSKLCMWLEDNWDHKFLIYDQDPMGKVLKELDPDGVIIVPYNPTAENIGKWLLEIVGPKQLLGTGCELIEVKIEETTKCSATCKKDIITNK